MINDVVRITWINQMSLKRLSIFLLFLFSLLFTLTCVAESASASVIGASANLPSRPASVIVGVYPVSLYNVSISKETFDTDFYIWWRTADKNFNPFQSVEIINAMKYDFKNTGTIKNGNEYLSQAHVYATIFKNWNVKNFPFIRADLLISLEDFRDERFVVFTPDIANSALSPEIRLPGWKVVKLRLETPRSLYSTSFGDQYVMKSFFSRFNFIIEIKQEGWRSYLDYFIGFFVSVFLCAMMYFVQFESVSTRYSFMLGGIFSSVGNKYIIDQVLPITSTFTLADVIQAATFLLIAVSILVTILLEKYAKRNAVRSRRLSLVLGASTLVIYILVVGYVTQQAVIS